MLWAMTTKNEALEKRPRPNGGVTGAEGIGIEREEGLSHRDQLRRHVSLSNIAKHFWTCPGFVDR
jgi:hypothetical protein